MLKLWLDDEREAPIGWDRAYSARRAIELLPQYDQISLDHDLGDDEAGSGYDVAAWIERECAEGRWNRVLLVSIHSANPVGRERMQACIRSAARFCSLVEFV